MSVIEPTMKLPPSSCSKKISVSEPSHIFINANNVLLESCAKNDSLSVLLEKVIRCFVNNGFNDSSEYLKIKLLGLISSVIASIDRTVNRQINQILNHSAFKKLEASWRGLQYLIKQLPEESAVNVKLLSITWREISKDLQKSIEFDQSVLFHKIYSEEFGMAGGMPFGLLVGDYQISGKDTSVSDITTLELLSQVAAAAFAPFIMGVSAEIFDVDSYAQLNPLKNYESFEHSPLLMKWFSFRKFEDSRFIGLVLPEIAMRTGYKNVVLDDSGCLFSEQIDHGSGVALWGNASFAFASVIIRSFLSTGWFNHLSGYDEKRHSNGLVPQLATSYYNTDKPFLMPKPITRDIITDSQEKVLAQLGLISLCQLYGTDKAAFYSNQSVQLPQSYSKNVASINAKTSTLLQYLLCASRFAHYVKVIYRDKIGSTLSASDCENLLHNWLTRYVYPGSEAGDKLISKYPLKEVKVSVKPIPGKIGCYGCVLHLKPRFQLEHITSSVVLVTELVSTVN